MALAEKIAVKHAFAPKTMKEAVNRSIDAQGQPEAIAHAFALSQSFHAYNQMLFRMPIDPPGLATAVNEKYPAGGQPNDLGSKKIGRRPS